MSEDYQKREILESLAKRKIEWYEKLEKENSYSRASSLPFKKLKPVEKWSDEILYNFVTKDFDPDLAFWAGNPDAQALIDYLPDEEIKRLRTENSRKVLEKTPWYYSREEELEAPQQVDTGITIESKQPTTFSRFAEDVAAKMPLVNKIFTAVKTKMTPAKAVLTAIGLTLAASGACIVADVPIYKEIKKGTYELPDGNHSFEYTEINDIYSSHIDTTKIIEKPYEGFYKGILNGTGLTIEFDNTSVEGSSIFLDLNNSEFSGIFEGAGHAYLKNTTVNGTVGGSITDMDLEGKLENTNISAIIAANITNGTGYGSFRNVSINGSMGGSVDNLTLEGLLDGTVTNLSLSGDLNAALQNVSLTGTYFGKLDETQIVGNITMTGAEFKKFFQNMTFNGTGIIHFANGNASAEFNGSFDTSQIDDNDTIILELDGWLKATYMNGTINAIVNGNAVGQFNGTATDGIVRGRFNGTARNGRYEGWINANASGDINLENLVADVSGYVNGTLSGDVIGKVRNGTFDGSYYGNATGEIEIDRISGTLKDFSGMLVGRVEKAKITGQGNVTGNASIDGYIISKTYDVSIERKPNTLMAAIPASTALLGLGYVLNKRKRALAEYRKKEEDEFKAKLTEYMEKQEEFKAKLTKDMEKQSQDARELLGVVKLWIEGNKKTQDEFSEYIRKVEEYIRKVEEAQNNLLTRLANAETKLNKKVENCNSNIEKTNRLIAAKEALDKYERIYELYYKSMPFDRLLTELQNEQESLDNKQQQQSAAVPESEKESGEDKK